MTIKLIERLDKNTDIGDVIVTREGNYYLVLDSSNTNKDYPKAICNLKTNKVEFNTIQGSLYVGCSLMGETIAKIIDKDKIKMVLNED